MLAESLRVFSVGLQCARFDITNRRSARFGLIQVFLLSIRTYWDHLDRSGYPISLSFATLLSKDAKALLLSDMVLVSTTALVVPVRVGPHFDIERTLTDSPKVHKACEERIDSLLLDRSGHSTHLPDDLCSDCRGVDVPKASQRVTSATVPSTYLISEHATRRQWP